MTRSTTRTTTRRLTAAALGCAALLGLAAATPASAQSAGDLDDRYTAEQIHTFLVDFYGEHGPSDFARKYAVSKVFTDQVGTDPGYDVLLCAQNSPESIDVGPVTTAQSARVGWATITTHWGQGTTEATFTAYVDLDATLPIQLLNVDCAPAV